MSRRYNFSQSQVLLDVNPKTFQKWLEEANIDPEEQRDKFDPRQKLLSEEQILLLAKAHDREVHFPAPEQPDEAHTDSMLAALSQRIDRLEQQITHRFDQLDADLAILRALLVDCGRTPAPVSAQGAPAASTPIVKAVSPLARTAPKKRTKPKSRRLPRTLTPLTMFREAHGISEKATDHARQTRKLPVTSGTWHHESRRITYALDRQQQHEFYTLFHERPGFRECPACPHIS